MSHSPPAHVPIGYWLRKADEALTARIDDAQRANNLSRLEWQMLNVLHEHGTASVAQVATALEPFADTAAIVEGIERLVQREVVEVTAPGKAQYQLTDEGTRLHGVALASQKELRQRAMEGVSQEDYATVIRVLEQIVRNLQS